MNEHTFVVTQMIFAHPTPSHCSGAALAPAKVLSCENWLSRSTKHEQSADKAEPFGIILCAGKDAEHVELLELVKSGIHVASYLTKMLPKKQLELKLHEAVRLARARSTK